MISKLFVHKRKSRNILLTIAASTAIAIYLISGMKSSYQQEDFFPKEDEDLQLLIEHQEKFEAKDDQSIFIGVPTNNSLFDTSFQKKLSQSSKEIEKLFGVEKIISPCYNCFLPELNGLSGVELTPCLTGNRKTDSIRILNDPLLAGTMVSRNAKASLIFIENNDSISRKEGRILLQEIDSILRKNGLPEFYISGKIAAFEYYNAKIISDFQVFFVISAILVCVFLWFSYRSWWGVLIPLITIVGSLIWSLFAMRIAGKDFDLLLTMLPTIVFIVGMSDLIHLKNKYIEELKGKKSKSEALQVALKEVGLATALTSGTTAIGFFTLQFINIKAISDFGLYAGISVIVTYFFTFLTFPFFLHLLPAPKNRFNNAKKDFWTPTLSVCYQWVSRKKAFLCGAGVLVFLVFTYLSAQLKVNTFLLEDLNEEDPVMQAYAFVEDNFSGVRPVEFQVQTKKNIFDYEVAKEIEKIENYLNTSYTEDGVGSLLSPFEAIKRSNMLKHNNQAKYHKLPRKKKSYNKQLKQIQKYTSIENPNKHYLSKDSSSCRISGRIKDPGSFLLEKENEAFFAFISDSINKELIDIKITGSAALLDKNNQNLSTSILEGLAVAFIVIAFVIGLIFRSIAFVIIALLVNILPLIIIAGTMLLLGMDIKTSTALIFTLAFGIAVDDTIHLLSKLKIELNKGKSISDALVSSYKTTGKAIIITSLILCGGFLSLIFSSFTSIHVMGVLVGITLFIAVIIDLTLLPAAILLLNKITSKDLETDPG